MLSIISYTWGRKGIPPPYSAHPTWAAFSLCWKVELLTGMTLATEAIRVGMWLHWVPQCEALYFGGSPQRSLRPSPQLWQCGPGAAAAISLLSISCGGYNKLLCNRKQRDSISPPFWKQNQGVSRAVFPPEALGEDPFLPLPASLWLVVPSLQSLPPSSHGLLLSLYLFLFWLLQENVSLDLGPTWVIQDDFISTSLIISAKNPFPNKVPCAGSRDFDVTYIFGCHH